MGCHLFEIVNLVFGVVIDHKVEIAEWLQQVLLGATATLAYPFENIGAHTQLPGEDFGNHRSLGVCCGVQH